jgi:hypothetical protein
VGETRKRNGFGCARNGKYIAEESNALFFATWARRYLFSSFVSDVRLDSNIVTKSHWQLSFSFVSFYRIGHNIFESEK